MGRSTAPALVAPLDVLAQMGMEDKSMIQSHPTDLEEALCKRINNSDSWEEISCLWSIIEASYFNQCEVCDSPRTCEKYHTCLEFCPPE